MCKYCEKGEPFSIYSTPRQTNLFQIKDINKLYCQMGFSYIYHKINYCPMCGKRLED